jgi:hypothetical protein
VSPCRGASRPPGRNSGWSPTLASGGSLAYCVSMHPVDEDWADGHIRAWDRDYRTGPGPVLTVHPAGHLPSGHVLNKRHSTFVLSWPETAQ